MTQLPEKSPVHWSEHLTEGLAHYLTDAEFVKDVAEYNRRYLFWDELKYRVPNADQRKMTWSVMKFYRSMRPNIPYSPLSLTYSIIPEIVKSLHTIDSYLTGNIRIHNKTIRLEQSYIINSFMEEAIASSILEGAATTRKAAKEMLRKGRKPKNNPEQMVINNYEAMNYILLHKDDLLTPDLILEIHRLVTKGTIDRDFVGQFRTNNDIVVANPATGVVFHTPPGFQEIEHTIAELCNFINHVDQDSGKGNADYIHPVIKGIILHLSLIHI